MVGAVEASVGWGVGIEGSRSREWRMNEGALGGMKHLYGNLELTKYYEDNPECVELNYPFSQPTSLTLVPHVKRLEGYSV